MFWFAKPLLTLSKFVIEKNKSSVNFKFISKLFNLIPPVFTIRGVYITSFLFLSILPVSFHKLSKLLKSKSLGGTTILDFFFILDSSSFFSPSVFGSFLDSSSVCLVSSIFSPFFSAGFSNFLQSSNFFFSSAVLIFSLFSLSSLAFYFISSISSSCCFFACSTSLDCAS